MKRKIRIIIAAIVAMVGIVAGGFLSKPAHAATWCSVDQDNASTYDSAAKKHCAYVILIDHASSQFTFKIMTGTYGNYKNTTKTVSSWCPSNPTQCQDIIKNVVSFKASQNSSVQTNAPGKAAFVNGVWSEIKQGVSHVDPCHAEKANATAYEQCKAGGNNSDYYTDKTKKKSDSGGGDGGDDEKKKSSGEEKADTGSCTSILPPSWCNKDNPDSLQENGIVSMVKFVLSVMTGAVVVAGSIGIVICGILWMTARENETQVATAKRRLLEIVIGIIAWALISVLINFFIPQDEETTDDLVSVEETIIVEKEA